MFVRGSVPAVMVLVLLISVAVLQAPVLAVGSLEPPRDLAASSGNGFVRLSWSPANGTVDEYWIYRATGTELELWTTLGNITVFIDQGLVNGQTYRYAVRALGPGGSSELSEEVEATPCTVPLAPEHPKATPGNQYLLLTWDPPGFDGGTPVTEYRVYEDGSLLGNTSERMFVHSLLSPGEMHTYQVHAINLAGEGAGSTPFSGAADIPPGPPSNLSLRAGVNNATLSWERPLDNGGSDPCGYIIYRAEGDGEMKPVISLDAAVLGHVDYGLNRSTSYRYRVSSFNLAGEGEPSGVMTVSIMDTGRVRVTTIIEDDGQVGLFWEGQGEGALRYWIYRGLSNDSLELLRSDVMEEMFWDRGLVNGVEYHYRIAVESPAGLNLSEIVAAVPHTTPGSPNDLVVQGRLGHIQLSWTAPSNDGGAQVLGYKVYMSSGGLAPGYLADVRDTEYICSALNEGVRYSFQVSAVNRAGEGTRTEVVTETCGVTPSVPTDVSAMAGDGYVQLSWSSPQLEGTGGISGYEVLRSGGAGEVILTSSSLGLNDTSVSNGAGYVYRVRAMNMVGPGDWSEEADANPIWSGDRPGKVMNLTALPGRDHIMLTWNVPEDGGQSIVRFDLYRGLGPDMVVYMTAVQGNWYNDTGLPSQVTYYYRVVAVNVLGAGEGSDLVNATTTLQEKEGHDPWGAYLGGAMPVVLTVLIIALAATYFLGRRMFFRDRGKGPKKGGKAAPPSRPHPPQKGRGSR